MRLLLPLRVFPLLLLYAALLGRAWWPHVGFALNQTQLARTQCQNRYKPGSTCNGQCVLMRQLRQATEQGSSEHVPGANLDPQPPHVAAESSVALPFATFPQRVPLFAARSFPLLAGHARTLVPPPWA